MKELKTGIRYVKVGNPEMVRYFTQASINLYDPERSGWVRDDGHDYSTPEDVVNFMESKTPEPAEQITPKDYSTTPTRELAEIMPDMTDDELLDIVKKDQRKTARSLAEKEIKNREK